MLATPERPRPEHHMAADRTSAAVQAAILSKSRAEECAGLIAAEYLALIASPYRSSGLSAQIRGHAINRLELEINQIAKNNEDNSND